VEAIPNIFNLAEQLVFGSIVFYEEICDLNALLTSSLRGDPALNL
jgi:hypothetical protein